MSLLLLQVIGLLFCSNIVMAFAWYMHLRNLNDKSLWLIIVASWLIALLEYVFLIPANRIGFHQANLSLSQLKILQEVITLIIFVPFAIFYMKQPITLNFVWASFCLAGAVYFIFK